MALRGGARAVIFHNVLHLCRQYVRPVIGQVFVGEIAGACQHPQGLEAGVFGKKLHVQAIPIFFLLQRQGNVFRRAKRRARRRTHGLYNLTYPGAIGQQMDIIGGVKGARLRRESFALQISGTKSRGIAVALVAVRRPMRHLRGRVKHIFGNIGAAIWPHCPHIIGRGLLRCAGEWRAQGLRHTKMYHPGCHTASSLSLLHHPTHRNAPKESSAGPFSCRTVQPHIFIPFLIGTILSYCL